MREKSYPFMRAYVCALVMIIGVLGATSALAKPNIPVIWGDDIGVWNISQSGIGTPPERFIANIVYSGTYQAHARGYGCVFQQPDREPARLFFVSGHGTAARLIRVATIKRSNMHSVQDLPNGIRRPAAAGSRTCRIKAPYVVIEPEPAGIFFTAQARDAVLLRRCAQQVGADRRIRLN